MPAGYGETLLVSQKYKQLYLWKLFARNMPILVRLQHEKRFFTIQIVWNSRCFSTQDLNQSCLKFKFLRYLRYGTIEVFMCKKCI